MDPNSNNNLNQVHNSDQYYNQNNNYNSGIQADQYMMQPANNNNYGQQNQYNQQMMMPGYPADPTTQGYNNNMMMGNNNNNMMMGNNNNMMGQPMMPSQNNQMQMMQQQQMQMMNAIGLGQPAGYDQDVYKQLLQADGFSKLANSSSFYLKGTHTSGCSDLLCMQSFFNKHNIRYSQFSTYTALSLDLEEPSCGASSVKGKVLDHKYGQNGEVISREPIFDIEHNRTCCALKCLCSWEHVFGMCGFYLCSLCFPSYSKVKKEEMTQHVIKYGCCGSSASITDGEGQQKYTLKRSGLGQTLLLDKDGQEINGFNCQIRESAGGTKNRRIVGMQITFPQNFSVEDKLAVLMSFSRMH